MILTTSLIDYIQKEKDTIKCDMGVDTETNVYEPFDEYIKQGKLKPLKLTKR